MTKLVIILTMIIILLLLYLYLIIVKKEEGFQVDLKPTTIKSYNDFLSFYNTFCSNWQKSIKSAVASDIPQKPLTDPSQVTSSDAPDIPESDMNNYISLLSQQLLKPLPSICKKLPSQLNSNSLVRIIKEVPKSTRPFINAINWMNSQLEQSQANLGAALQGISPLESFEDMCDNVSACIENNPELAKKVAVNIAEQQKKEQETQEEQLLKAINPFLTEPELRRTYDKNIMLFKQAEEIQTKAESGQLLNQMSIQDNDIDIKYTKPPGANNLNNMKQNDPARYNEVQTNYKQLFSIKKLIDQINSNIK